MEGTLYHPNDIVPKVLDLIQFVLAVFSVLVNSANWFRVTLIVLILVSFSYLYAG